MTLHCGDNLEIMRGMEDESIDLIYLDPPYFTQKDWGQFDDRFNDIDHYIEFMRERVVEMCRLLKPTGSIYFHCDWHAVHYVKVMMDDVFGYDNFQNHVVWHYSRWTCVARRYQIMHNDILFYTKTDDRTFNVEYCKTDYTIENSVKGYRAFNRNGVRELVVYDKVKAKAKIDSGKYDKIIYNSNNGIALADVWYIKAVPHSGGGTQWLPHTETHFSTRTNRENIIKRRRHHTRPILREWHCARRSTQTRQTLYWNRQESRCYQTMRTAHSRYVSAESRYAIPM